MKRQLFRLSPLSGALFGVLMIFALIELLSFLFPLLPLVLLNADRLRAIPWDPNIPIFILFALLLIIPLVGGGRLCGLFFSALLHERFSRLPDWLINLWSGIAVVLLPLSPLLVLLPTVIRPQDRRILRIALVILPLFAAVFARPGLSILHLTISVESGTLPLLLYAASLSVAFAAAGRFRGPGPAVISMAALYLALFTADALYILKLDRDIGRLIAELETEYGTELSEAAYWAYDRRGVPLSEPPWRELAAAMEKGEPKELIDDAQTAIALFPSPPTAEAFAAFRRERPELAAAADLASADGSVHFAHNYSEIISVTLLPELNIVRSLGWIYAREMQLAARDGRRKEALEKNRRIEHLAAIPANTPVLASALAGSAVEAVRRHAWGPLLRLPVFSDEDLKNLAVGFRTGAERHSRALRASLSGEIVMFLNAFRVSQQPPKLWPVSDEYCTISVPYGYGFARLNCRLDMRIGLKYFRNPPPASADEHPARRGPEQPRYAFISNLLLPDLAALQRRQLHNRDAAVMAELAVAVERYRRKHGETPVELAELVPEFIAAVPVSESEGEPFLYQPDKVELPIDGETVCYPGYQIFMPGSNQRRYHSYDVVAKVE